MLPKEVSTPNRAENFKAPRYTSSELRRIRQAYKNGESPEAIASELGRSSHAIRIRALKMGLSKRNQTVTKRKNTVVTKNNVARNNLSKVLIAYRQKYDLQQQEFARMLGIDSSVLSAIERGENFSQEYMFKIMAWMTR